MPLGQETFAHCERSGGRPLHEAVVPGNISLRSAFAGKADLKIAGNQEPEWSQSGFPPL